MSFDSVLNDKVGSLGRWQLLTFFLLVIPAELPVSMIPQLANLSPVFICTGPWFRGWSFRQISNFSSALAQLRLNSSSSYDFSCQRFDLKVLSPLLSSNLSIERKLSKAALHNLSLETCSGQWVFDAETAPYRHSLIEDFELVCERKYLIPYSVSWYAVGMVIGYIVGGFLSDRFGRLTIVKTTFILMSVCLMLIGLCRNFWLFLTMRLVCGCIFNAGYIAAVTLYLEITNDKHRNSLNTLNGFVIDLITLPAGITISYLLQDWRWVHFAIGVLILAFVSSYFFLLNESPRWLLAKRKPQEALKVIQRAIRLNNAPSKRQEGSLTIDDILSDQETTNTLAYHKGGCLLMVKDWITFFKMPRILWRLVPMAWIWIAVVLTYYVIAFYGVRLDGNPYVIALLITYIGSPAYIIKFFLAAKFGRKRPLVGVLIFTALSIIAAFFGMLIQNSGGLFVIIMATITVGGLASTFALIYLYSPELFHTMQRTKALGFFSAVSRLGLIGGTFIERLDQVWRPFPIMILSLAMFLTIPCALVLPHDSRRIMLDVGRAEKEKDKIGSESNET